MKIINIILLTFISLSINAKNRVLFLYDPKQPETKKREFIFLNSRISRNQNITKIKINKKWMKNEDQNILKLIDKIYIYYQKRHKIDHKKIDIIATGNGIHVLKEILETFNQMELNPIGKTIIIGSQRIINYVNILPYSPNRAYCGMKKKPLRKLEIATSIINKKGNFIGHQLIEPKGIYRGFEITKSEHELVQSEEELLPITAELADSEYESSYYSESYEASIKDEESSSTPINESEKTEPISIKKKDTNELILIRSDEYVELLNRQKGEDPSCFGWCKKNWTPENTDSLINLTTLIISILAS